MHAGPLHCYCILLDTTSTRRVVRLLTVAGKLSYGCGSVAVGLVGFVFVRANQLLTQNNEIMLHDFLRMIWQAAVLLPHSDSLHIH